MTETFIQILNMSISALWLILAVLVLRVVLKKAPRWVSVLLWGFVAVRLLCPFTVESALSLVPTARTIAPEILMDSTPTIDTGISGINQKVNPLITEYSSPAAGASVNPLQIVFGIGANIWLIGLFAMLLYGLLSYILLRRTVRTAVRMKDNIYQCEQVDSPFVLGVLKPHIYLPYHLGDQSTRHVIAHEQAHILRKDHWWKPLGYLLLTAHWFNPLVWIAYILLCRDIELACDEKVIKELGIEERAEYSAALLSCSIRHRRIAACPVAFGEVSVKSRIKSVFSYKKPAVWLVAGALILCGILAVCFLTNPLGSSGTPDLSFLNYENAITLVADRDKVQAIYCPPETETTDGLIQVGEVGGNALATYLDLCSWRITKEPLGRLPSPGSVEFVIAEDHRIQVYQRRQWRMHGYAKVTYGDDVRYYAIAASDYKNAVSLLYPSNNSDKESLWEITKTNDSYYLTIGGEGVTEIHLSSPTFSGGCSHADGSAFRIGEKVYLEQLDEWTDLTGVKIQALDAQGKTLYMCSILSDMGRQTLSLNDVIMLSQKGDALTWSDFDPFRYTENGSGLYIREYPINDMFTLWIGGTDTDTKPMYVYLGLTDKRDVRIDIRYRDVTEFIFRADRNPTFEVTFAGDSSVQQFFSVSEYQPYWSIWVENTGKASIIMEVGGETYRIEPGTSESITPDEKWEPGSYTVSFTSSDLSGMTGHAVCEVFSVLLGTVEIKA